MDADYSPSQDFDIVNVDFEWFNFDPEIDFHGTKGLLRQLFDVDANLFNMSALSDLVVAQNTIGSTVKVDGKATDAYALATVLNLAENAAKDPVGDITRYLGDKARAAGGSLASAVPPLLDGKRQVGLVLSERLINVPPEIAPPLFSMMVDEVEAAVEDKEPYDFSHYLIVSKTYREIESALDDDRKRKKAKAGGEPTTFYFHPEDEVFQKHAVAHGSYNFTKEDDLAADSKRAFQEMGIKPYGHMILIEAAKFPAAVKAVQEYIGGPQQQ